MRLFSVWSHRLDREEDDQWVAVLEVPDDATVNQEAKIRARALLAAYLTQEDLNHEEEKDSPWYQFYTDTRIPPDYKETGQRVTLNHPL